MPTGFIGEPKKSSDAKVVKIVSSLMMVISVIGLGVAATISSGVLTGFCSLILFIGFIGFIVGRFME